MEEGMMITVEGEELLPEEFSAEYGWRSVAIKKSAGRGRPGDRPRAESGGSGREAEHSRRAKGARNKIIKASRMPPLPKEHFRIIFRPRGGLDVRKTGPIRLGQAIFTAAGLGLDEVIQDIICPNTMQNIIVASTPSRVNADAYLKVELITIGESQHEVSTYEAAPHATCKGEGPYLTKLGTLYPSKAMTTVSVFLILLTARAKGFLELMMFLSSSAWLCPISTLRITPLHVA
ncbi:hypothetical protein HPB52_006152 [Rhipicephalus sanguineus]|uniref:Uncharacterized protein n=1 Tax=Rhipicephalus sanguineus TaxID=34632 RepID=A0A9D4PEW8_RHISA|nr:hypothetical protein HPB52_006152 [Rhipicephalus sanguineus]